MEFNVYIREYGLLGNKGSKKLLMKNKAFTNDIETKSNLLSEITLRWYDDSSLLSDDRRELLELFLDTLGISRDVAADLFEVLMLAKARGTSLTSKDIREQIVATRKDRGVTGPEDALTIRNIQIWVKYFRNLGMIEKIGSRYTFKGNRKPSCVFRDSIKPEVIDKSADYVCRVLEKLEKEYGIKK